MGRFLCIHGHFYQPPRENPWLEAIEVQDGAYPYHDWNQRIKAECYSNNAASRILDDEGRIKQIVSNYAKINFDIGPTLLLWLQKNSPTTYEAIIEADRQSLRWRSGHGAAIAQCYNHMIMPLCNPRDRVTQVGWGIRDFRHRFGRMPEGMWLPETAVDIETLDVMARMGIKFTVLAPHQAQKIRAIDSDKWEDVSDAKIDPKAPYTCRLPSGRSIALFFYDGPVSRAVAFEGLLNSGEGFAQRLISGFDDENGGNQLMHIATDGESYGHHHRYGEMALSAALDHIEREELAQVTNYAEYLASHPPEREVGIFEHTSWSCAHGTERWRADCGCGTGANPKWNQEWRTPLREALDWLRDELASAYETTAAKYLADPWVARDDYIDVILNRSPENIEEFLRSHGTGKLGRGEQVTAIKLLELQRHAMLMYTSCGWFFDDISGIETIQVLQYAGRAIQLGKEALGVNLEPGFTERLESAKSNIGEMRDGARIYEQSVKPRVLNLKKVAAHFAISSLFEDYDEETSIYCYRIKQHEYSKSKPGSATLVTGRCNIASEITGESENLSFCVLHLGNHDFNCGVRRFVHKDAYEALIGEITTAFEHGAFAQAIRQMDKRFGANVYSLKDLFKDEQRMILETLIKETMDGFEDSYRRMYEDHRLLMSFLKETGIPVPKAFYTAAEFILNLDIKRELQGTLEREKVAALLNEFELWDVQMDTVGLEFELRNTLAEKMRAYRQSPSDMELLEDMLRALGVADMLPFEPNLWGVQNRYYRMAGEAHVALVNDRPTKGDGPSFAERFMALGRKLNFNLDYVLDKK